MWGYATDIHAPKCHTIHTVRKWTPMVTLEHSHHFRTVDRHLFIIWLFHIKKIVSISSTFIVSITWFFSLVTVYSFFHFFFIFIFFLLKFDLFDLLYVQRKVFNNKHSNMVKICVLVVLFSVFYSTFALKGQYAPVLFFKNKENTTPFAKNIISSTTKVDQREFD